VRSLKHLIRLEGPNLKGRMPASTMRELMNVVLEGAKRVLRQRVEGRSVSTGPTPAWLEAASEFELIGFGPGSTAIEIEAPSLLEAAAARFGQQDFFLDVDPTRSALGYFEENLAEAVAGTESGDDLDDGILAAHSDFSRLLGRDVVAVEFSSSSERGPGTIRISEREIQIVSALRRKMPGPRNVLVAGTLDMIRHSDRMFALILLSGATVRGIADAIPANTLAKLFGGDVLISGKAVFRPDGSVLRLEAETINRSSGDVSFWSRAPKPLDVDTDIREFRVLQGPRTGINAWIGSWPGEEPDREVALVLEDMS